MKKPIKVIKRAASQAPESSPRGNAPSVRRQAERDLQESVNAWIEERRRNDKVETGIAHVLLRQLFA
jgi:hypothetical protein